jgi:hypothetical protein
VLSAHAATVLKERGISAEWMERVLLSPERSEFDRADPELRHAIGPISERGDRYLRVIYNSSTLPWRIVTLYFDRGLKRAP